MSYNGRAGQPDLRSNNEARKARKRYLLSTPEFGGDGNTVKCIHCSTELTYDTVQSDRIIPGGTYRRDNVQPSCSSCNKRRSNNIDWTYEPVSV